MVLDDGPAWLGPRPAARGIDKKYFNVSINHRRGFAKQSKRPDEMAPDTKDPKLLSRQCAARLRNEAAAINFVSRNTRIPVPTILGYHDDGNTVALATAQVPGVPMWKLEEYESRLEVSRQLDEIVSEMREITWHEATGFAGPICLHPAVRGSSYCDLTAPVAGEPGTSYPMCHGDLSASNVIVNRETCKINAVIDWEYAGFYPAIMDFSYYRVAIATPRRCDAAMYPQGYLAACHDEVKRMTLRLSNLQSTTGAALVSGV